MSPQLIVIATAIVLTIVLTAALIVLSNVARRSRSSAIRVAAAVAIVVAVLLSPVTFDAAVTHLNPTSGMTYVSIDPGWMIKIAPAVIAAIIAAALIGRWHAPSHSPR